MPTFPPWSRRGKRNARTEIPGQMASTKAHWLERNPGRSLPSEWIAGEDSSALSHKWHAVAHFSAQRGGLMGFPISFISRPSSRLPLRERRRFSNPSSAIGESITRSQERGDRATMHR